MCIALHYNLHWIHQSSNLVPLLQFQLVTVIMFLVVPPYAILYILFFWEDNPIHVYICHVYTEKNGFSLLLYILIEAGKRTTISFSRSWSRSLLHFENELIFLKFNYLVWLFLASLTHYGLVCTSDVRYH